MQKIEWYRDFRGTLVCVDRTTHRAWAFHDGEWKQADHLAADVTGRGGQVFDDITSADVQHQFPDAFEHRPVQ